MRILAVDTATERQTVAILEDEQILARADHDAHGAHAKLLVPTIDRLLASRQLTLKQLHGLVVSIGPGSFTGLRVGVATMLGFRLVTGLPLVGVPTLEGLAWNLRGNALPVCPILKARTGELYWALYRWTDRMGQPTLECLSQPRLDTPARLAAVLIQPVTVLGDGWLTYRSDIQQHMSEQGRPEENDVRHFIQEAPGEAMRPSAVNLGYAGYHRFALGDVAGPGLSPLYVQRAEAEVLWETKQRKRENTRVS